MKKKHEQSKEEPTKEQEYLEGWKRARADLENIQKRMGNELTGQRDRIKRDVIESLIPLMDNFRSLVDHAPEGNDPWVQGVVHVGRQAEQVLQDLGVEVIQQTGVPFDPNIHEAVDEVSGDEEKGSVVGIVQVGYRLADKTIRPAKVTISK